MSDISIALNRFGYGLRTGEAPPADGKAWLLGQFARYDPKPDSIANAPTTAGVAADLASYFREQQALRKWHFKPATRDGVPEESWRTMTLTFVLRD